MNLNKQWNNPNGMSTKIWGPMIWNYLHTVSFNYPVEPTKEQKKQYRDLIYSVGRTLPCKYCRINFEKNIVSVPLNKHALKNRNTFSRWLYRFHSHINKMLGKETTITYNQVRQKYNSYRATSCIKSHKKKDKSKKNKSNKEFFGCHSSKDMACTIIISQK